MCVRVCLCSAVVVVVVEVVAVVVVAVVVVVVVVVVGGGHHTQHSNAPTTRFCCSFDVRCSLIHDRLDGGNGAELGGMGLGGMGWCGVRRECGQL